MAALVFAACSSPSTRGSAPAGAPSASQRIYDAGYRSATYSNPANWLCRPGLPPSANACSGSQDTTAVSARGHLTVEHHAPASHPGFDCFYVYPTVDPGKTSNAPLTGPHPAEISVTRTQAAPFSRLCRMYVPFYRQVTLQALFSAKASPNRWGIAYSDVADSFRYYLGHLNHGRPFVLIGHSQGSILLAQLMAKQIDPVPGLRARMVSAIIPGDPIAVPSGGYVGATFRHIPACRSRSQTSCVIGYSSFKASEPPGPHSLFGRTTQPGTQALCVNPGNLGGGTGSSATLDPIFAVTPGSPLPWAPGTGPHPDITTPYVSLPGMVSARCVVGNGASYLQLSFDSEPGPRAHNLAGDLGPSWGMHVVDVNVALGNLLGIVADQGATALHAR